MNPQVRGAALYCLEGPSGRHSMSVRTTLTCAPIMPPAKALSTNCHGRAITAACHKGGLRIGPRGQQSAFVLRAPGGTRAGLARVSLVVEPGPQEEPDGLGNRVGPGDPIAHRA